MGSGLLSRRWRSPKAALRGVAVLAVALVGTLPPACDGVRAASPLCAANPQSGAADFSQPVTLLRARDGSDPLEQLKLWQIRTLIRYYDHADETIPCKTLLRDESDALTQRGFSLIVVFQHNNDDPATFFDRTRGAADAARALVLAEANGQPYGTTIYFGVDGVDDAMQGLIDDFRASNGGPMAPDRQQKVGRKRVAHYEWFRAHHAEVFGAPVDRLRADDVLPFIRTYFDDVKSVFDRSKAEHGGQGYDIGAYGSGAVCMFLQSGPLKPRCWLAQSRAWPGYAAFRDSKQWVMLQENPTTCAGWFFASQSDRPAQFDFNRFNADGRPSGQWSQKRDSATAVGRSPSCVAALR